LKSSKKQRIGEYIACSIGGEQYNAYVPQSLPPSKPPLKMEDLYPLLDQANTALGRLDGMSMILPDHSLFLYMYIRKEAVFSSQIEGTQSTLTDLLLLESEEAPGVPIDDVTEVSCYVYAMEYGLNRLKEGFPLSLRLIREIHDKLMARGRGSDKLPGEFRSTQNWIGGSRPGNAYFVPPPPIHLMETLDKFEKFLHDHEVKLPALIKAALVHVQFETIHPFLDGNGRLGRLLITFLLCVEGVLQKPILYLSLYFKKNRQAYYDHLQSVRETGDWEAWIEFFLTGVIETASQGTQTAQAIIHMLNKDRSLIEKSTKQASTILTIHTYLQRHPISNTTKIKESLNVSLPTVLRSLKTLVDLEIVKEVTGKGRHKVFVYEKYLDVLNKGTEPLER
jgi:Fic family protein